MEECLFKVNSIRDGPPESLHVEPREEVLEVLRESLNLRGNSSQGHTLHPLGFSEQKGEKEPVMMLCLHKQSPR